MVRVCEEPGERGGPLWVAEGIAKTPTGSAMEKELEHKQIKCQCQIEMEMEFYQCDGVSPVVPEAVVSVPGSSVDHPTITQVRGSYTQMLYPWVPPNGWTS